MSSKDSLARALVLVKRLMSRESLEHFPACAGVPQGVKTSTDELRWGLTLSRFAKGSNAVAAAFSQACRCLVCWYNFDSS